MKVKISGFLILLLCGIAFTVLGTSAVCADGYSKEYMNPEKQAYVGLEQFSQIRDSSWVDNCLDLSGDMRKFGVKIIAYRIQWFNGNWSGWFVPGINDLYKKDGEPLRRQWACFNDHSFEIMYTAPEKVEWKAVEESKRKDDDYNGW